MSYTIRIYLHIQTNTNCTTRLYRNRLFIHVKCLIKSRDRGVVSFQKNLNFSVAVFHNLSKYCLYKTYIICHTNTSGLYRPSYYYCFTINDWTTTQTWRGSCLTNFVRPPPSDPSATEQRLFPVLVLKPCREAAE